MEKFEANYYETIDNLSIRCGLCPHNCVIRENGYGICSVRKNIKGKLISEIYGKVTSIALDPIEKKPLYHFYPGSQILSIGTKGCNLKCPYCQNWHISQDPKARTSFYPPDDIVRMAVNENSIGIAYTYSEPIIWYEYVLETSKTAKKNNLNNVMVTNGFINKDPLAELLKYTDAYNIDLKSFREETYKKIQKGNLSDVISTIEMVNESACHMEITTLIVTGMNDDMDEMKDIIDFISSIDKNIPWHISRYYPNYKYDEKATDINFLMNVHDEAIKKLNFVFCGNVPTSRIGNNTICPSCKSTVISRSGYFTKIENLDDNKCLKCGSHLGITS